MNPALTTDSTIISCSLFSGLPANEIALISEFARIDMVLRKDVLNSNIDGVPHVLVIRKGFMKVVQLLTNASEVVVELIGPGEIYGRTSPVDLTKTLLAKSPDYVEAIEDTSIVIFTQADFEHLLHNAPHLQTAVMEQLSERSYRMRERLSDIAFRTVKSRLCAILLRHGSLYG